MNIYIGSDHGGFALKKELVDFLHEGSYGEVIDVGPFEYNPEDDFPDFAEPVAKAVANEENSLGILICKSGNGMCIAANKVDGAYAALSFSVKHAVMARRDDNANVLCLDSEYDGDSPIKIVEAFITTQFAGMDTKYGRRFQKIQELENE